MARKSNPKRHHFVPQMLLNGFTDDDGWLYVFNRAAAARGILRSRPQQTFAENHLNTAYDLDGRRDFSNEQFLSQLESDSAPIADKIVSAARNFDVPALMPEEKGIWDRFFICQWYRVPDMHMPEEDMGHNLTRITSDLASELSRRNALTPEVIAIRDSLLSDPDERSRTVKSVRARIGVESSDTEPMRIIADKGIRIARISKPNRSFVIGSNPISKMTHSPDRSHLADPAVEAWLPIAHDVAIAPALSRGQEQLLLVKDNRFVKQLNQSIAQQSSAFAGRSSTLVRSLARKAHTYST